MTEYEELWYAIQRLNMRLREHERLKRMKDTPEDKASVLDAQIVEARRQLDDEKSTVVALLLNEA